jgi:hypothetical protein
MPITLIYCIASCRYSTWAKRYTDKEMRIFDRTSLNLLPANIEVRQITAATTID